MSSNNMATAGLLRAPVSSYLYRQIMPSVEIAEEPGEIIEPQVTISEREFALRIEEQRARGFAEAETKLRQQLQVKADHLTALVTGSISAFEEHQKGYFARVEGEVVKLALAIAGKILHREAQVDPMLVGALVHLAIEQLKEGSSASIRVRPEQAQKWRDHVAQLAINLDVKIVEDKDLVQGDCILETELGMVNFSLDAQLKEVERGFFDVLAQKPQI